MKTSDSLQEFIDRTERAYFWRGFAAGVFTCAAWFTVSYVVAGLPK